MTASSAAPQPDRIEQEYTYRYRWTAVAGVTALGGVLAAGFMWLAWSQHRPWLWVVVVPLLGVFVLGLRTASINLRGSRHLILTPDAMYFPGLWNLRSYACVRFADIVAVDTFENEGATFCELWAGKKKHRLSNAWLPQGDFEELVSIIYRRIPPTAGHEPADLS